MKIEEKIYIRAGRYPNIVDILKSYGIGTADTAGGYYLLYKDLPQIKKAMEHDTTAEYVSNKRYDKAFLTVRTTSGHRVHFMDISNLFRMGVSVL